MKMYTLLKKDLLLAGDYFWLSPACAIGVPVFLSAQDLPRFSSIYVLLTGVSLSCYFLFSSIFAMEDKYKGNLYLMAIPYKKRNLVEAKYLLAVLMYLFTLICCQVISFTKIQGIALAKYKLTFSDAAIVFLSYQWSGVYFFAVLSLLVWKDKGCADCENAYSSNMCTDRTGSPDGIGYNL